MSYQAELDANGIVIRVVAASSQWVADNLGGTWVETSDPYAAATPVMYAGIAMGYADNLPDLFAPVWDETHATTPDADGNYPYNGGEVVWHEGRLWRNVTEGVPNVWEPGVSGWHDAPVGEIPQWVAPTGAHDAYAKDAEVTHLDKFWRSNIDANVWEPPEQWTEFTP